MRLVFDRERLLAWAAERLPRVEVERSCAIGVEAGGRLLAVAVYFAHRGHDVEMGICADSPRWCRRGVLRAMFDYPFRQLGCVRVTAVVAANNARARRLVEGLGFRAEGFHRQGFAPGEDAVSYGMQRSECRWA